MTQSDRLEACAARGYVGADGPNMRATIYQGSFSHPKHDLEGVPPETNTKYARKIIMLTGNVTLEELNWVSNVWPNTCDHCQGMTPQEAFLLPTFYFAGETGGSRPRSAMVEKSTLGLRRRGCALTRVLYDTLGRKHAQHNITRGMQMDNRNRR